MDLFDPKPELNKRNGKPMPKYTDRGVEFALSHPPTRSRAAGRVMFFPHLKTPHKGILNAMANEFVEDNNHSRIETAQKTSEWLAAQISNSANWSNSISIASLGLLSH